MNTEEKEISNISDNEESLDSLIRKKKSPFTIYSLLLNKEAIDKLEEKAKTSGFKKTALARLAINYAIKMDDFWEIVKTLKKSNEN